MTTLKKIFAAATAVASVGVLTMATIPASAAVTIPYSGPSEKALCANDDGATVRLNILNEWRSDKIMTVDIPKASVVNEYISVEFEITGLNGRTSNVDDAGNPTDSYVASLQGQAGGNQIWGADATTTPITGDGTYTVTWTLAEASASIECLILSTNINFYQFGENIAGIEDSGIAINVLSVTTGDDPANAGSGEGEESGDVTTTTTTGEGGEGSTTTTTTTKSNSSSSGSSSNKTNSSSSSSNKTSNSTTSTVTKTADAGVVAIVVGAAAAASLAVGTMTYKRKRK